MSYDVVAYETSAGQLGPDPGTQTLTVPPGATVAVTTEPGEQLDLSSGVNATVDMHVEGTLTLTTKSIQGTLDADGGTIRFIGNNLFAGPSQTVFDDDLAGSGTLTLTGAGGEGSVMELGGSVGGGLTFNLQAAIPVVALQIDQPQQFHAAIDLPPAPGLDYVAFMGLHATQADLLANNLLMFNGGALVDAVRLTGGTNLQLQQNSSGVILSEGYGGNAPGGSGTAIPLHIGLS
jgi:hypothetical protein